MNVDYDNEIVEFLRNKAVKNLDKAYAPYSHHPVSAIAIVVYKNEEYYVHGVNVENIVNGCSVCAENSLISNVYTKFGKVFKIKNIVIVGPDEKLLAPCGKCRQTVAEHCDKNTIINDGWTIEKLLPGAPILNVY